VTSHLSTACGLDKIWHCFDKAIGLEFDTLFSHFHTLFQLKIKINTVVNWSAGSSANLGG